MTTYICRAYSVQHNIPRREDCPEVGICPICLEAHALYLAKRGPVSDDSPWVLVEERLPEPGEIVLGAWGRIAARKIGWINNQGHWYVPPGVRSTPPDCWCPIPPLPEEA